MKLPADRQLLYICQQIAAVGIVLFFVVLLSGITFGWRGYFLNYPEAITDTVPSGFPVIAGRHTSSNSGMGNHELVTWEEWKRRQTQGAAYVWVRNGAGAGEAHLESGRKLFYTFRMNKLAPQRYMVDVTVSDREGMENRAQYRVEDNHVIPLTFGVVTEAMMALGVVPMALVVAVLFCWSLRASLRWYTRYTGGEKEIRELLSKARLTLSLLVGYYLFLASRRASRLVWQRS
jgi:hypothetical protein